MKKTFIIFLFIIFSSSFSLAKNNQKITIQEIEDIFLKYEYSTTEEMMTSFEKELEIIREKENKESYKKRFQNRGIAKCRYSDKPAGGNDAWLQCNAKIIRAVLTYSEKNKKRRPGDIFYALDAMSIVSNDYFKFVKMFTYNKGDKPVPSMVCRKRKISEYEPRTLSCRAFKRSTYKKIEKFKKDPSDEKVLGHALIKYIKNQKMINKIKEEIGTDNYALLGDMLNAVVVDVEKNNISPGLLKRRVLLKKYSLILLSIQNKLDEENYKSINKDISKLSKTYESLRALTTNPNLIIKNVDKAVNIIFDTNKLVIFSALNTKDDEEEKLLAKSSITFMESLIDSILSTIPEKYFVKTKELSPEWFEDYDLAELEVIVNNLIKKSNEIKSAELIKSMDLINKSINTSNIVKMLDSLGMKNRISRTFTQNTAAEIATQQIRDNLDRDILKSAKKILENIDKNDLSDLTKQASNIASEISSDPSFKASVSNNVVDRKFGGQGLKTLIAASRR